MTPDDYQRFTQELTARLSADARVLGLVALGSMAAQDYQPDQWSDHDFFVVTTPGVQENLRADLSWLPAASDIVLRVRETAHGVNVVYNTGHLLEFAVFDTEELYLAGVNRYRVLLDRAGMEGHMQAIVARTSERNQPTPQSDARHMGMFLSGLLVGAGRHRRGERLSAIEYIKSHAVRHLLSLLQRHVPAQDKRRLDNLNPNRRFEQVYPALGREIELILGADTLVAARGLLDLADRELAQRLPDYPSAAAVVVRRLISNQDTLDESTSYPISIL